ncbi:hypothetical protein R1sor_022675 [Riccia sorocarpa]|uniref:Uncharacterized protein n=1 Tax=Riccia sorocarpa TaxID=122646 RepID=A0ABD3GPS5_9MARC
MEVEKTRLAQAYTVGSPQQHAKTEGHGTVNSTDETEDQEDNDELLQDIPEPEDEGEEESEADGSEYENREPTYIERHQAWVDVLDENLQSTRKNPANKEASKDFDMDLGELLSAVEDIIETSEDRGNVATETEAIDCNEGRRQQVSTKTTEEFRTVQRRRTKPKFFTPEIKKTMKVNNRYSVLDEATNTEGDTELEDSRLGVRSRRVESNEPTGPGAAGAGFDPSSSKGRAAHTDTNSKTEMYKREIVDLTKTRETKETKGDGTKTREPSRTAGIKHLQEDREKRLSSVGAITPPETAGRKKLKNQQGGQGGAGSLGRGGATSSGAERLGSKPQPTVLSHKQGS